MNCVDKSAELLNVKAGSACGYHCAWNGQDKVRQSAVSPKYKQTGMP